MKNVAKKDKLPLFVIQHTNTAAGSSMKGTKFKLSYLRREDAERSSAYLTSIGVDHKLVAPRVDA